MASLEERGDRSKFDHTMIGFGLLAQGFGYYASISALALLAYLARRRPPPGFLQALGHIAALCGQAQLSRSIGLGNHPAIAERVLAAVCGMAESPG